MHYLQPFPLTQGQVLIEQGSRDRQVYLVEQGMLSVHLEDDKGRLRMAMLGAGTLLVLGQGAGALYQFDLASGAMVAALAQGLPRPEAVLVYGGPCAAS